jgi:uncharacterized membrane protein YphA (DoxX/SURF4 family)
VYPPTLASFFTLTFFEIPHSATLLCSAGIVIFLIGIVTAKNDLVQTQGLDRAVALSNLCFAMPLAVFGTQHFTDTQSIAQMVPSFMPWHLFWTYFVGIAMLAASLSIAAKVQVQWSGLLFGIMMFVFVAMMDLPGALADRHNRIAWILMLRELSFGCGGWCLAGFAMQGEGAPGGYSKIKSKLITVARIVIGVAAVVYGAQQFLYPKLAPGVPLERPMDAWIPARAVIGYLTGVILLVCGVFILLARKTRTAAAYLGSWILLLVLFVYGPMLIAALQNPNTGEKVVGIDYFFDTLLYAGTVLALANASPHVRHDFYAEKSVQFAGSSIS